MNDKYEQVVEELNLFRFKKNEIGKIEVEIEDFYRRNYLSEEALFSDFYILKEEHDQKKIRLELESEYPNLVISKGGLWLKQAEGTPISSGLRKFDLARPDHDLLFKLNETAEKLKDRTFFYCTACMKPKNRKSEFAGSVFANRSAAG
jgi:hypothetical protein